MARKKKRPQKKKEEPITIGTIRRYRQRFIEQDRKENSGQDNSSGQNNSSVSDDITDETLVEMIYAAVQRVKDIGKCRKKKEEREDIEYHVALFTRSIVVGRLWRRLKEQCADPPDKRKYKIALEKVRKHKPKDNQSAVNPELLEKYERLLEIADGDADARWLQFSGFSSCKFYKGGKPERSDIIKWCIEVVTEEHQKAQKERKEEEEREEGLAEIMNMIEHQKAQKERKEKKEREEGLAEMMNMIEHQKAQKERKEEEEREEGLAEMMNMREELPQTPEPAAKDLAIRSVEKTKQKENMEEQRRLNGDHGTKSAEKSETERLSKKNMPSKMNSSIPLYLGIRVAEKREAKKENTEGEIEKRKKVRDIKIVTKDERERISKEILPTTSYTELRKTGEDEEKVVFAGANENRKGNNVCVVAKDELNQKDVTSLNKKGVTSLPEPSRVEIMDKEEKECENTTLENVLSSDVGSTDISDKPIGNCMAWCNKEAAKKVIPVIFFDPIAFASEFSEKKIVAALNEQYFAKMNFTPMTAKYLFIPVHDKRKDHWLSLLVDLRSKTMYSFDSLTAHSTEEDIAITSSMVGAAEAVVRCAKIVCVVYNNYMKKARDSYNLKQENECTFRLFRRMFIETQEGRNCGIYPMGMAYQMVTQDSGIEDLFSNIDSHNYRYNLSRDTVKSLRSQFTKMFEATPREREKERYMSACIQLFYKIWNCLTYEGSRQIEFSISWVSNYRESGQLEKIFESMKEYFNEKTSKECGNPSKSVVASPLKLALRITNEEITRGTWSIVTLSIAEQHDNTGRYPYTVRLKSDLVLEFGTRFFGEKTDSKDQFSNYKGLL